MLSDYFIQIRNTSKRNNKIALLKNLFKHSILKNIFKYAYESLYVYGIKNLKTTKQGTKEIDKKDLKMFFALLDKQIKNPTNNKTVKNQFLSFLSKFKKPEQDLLISVINKDLEIGVNTKTILSLDPDLITDFGPMLAQKYREDKIKYPCYAEKKYDGVRCVYDPKTNKLFTRNNNELLGYTHITNELKKLKLNWCLDGELMDDNFDKLMTSVQRQKNKKSVSIKFHVFDCFDSNLIFTKTKSCNIKLERRKKILDDIFSKHNLEHTKKVDFYIMSDFKEIERLYRKFLSENLEGIMLKNTEAYYEFKRSFNYMKIKPTDNMDMQVIKVYEGKGRLKNRCGSVDAVSLDGKVQSNVGVTTDELSKYFWENKNKSLIIEVKYDSITKDNSLRFPRIVKLRKDL